MLSSSTGIYSNSKQRLIERFSKPILPEVNKKYHSVVDGEEYKVIAVYINPYSAKSEVLYEASDSVKTSFFVDVERFIDFFYIADN